MTLAELTGMVTNVLREDQRKPETYKPLVAIGHTKDFTDPHTLDQFLGFLTKNEIRVTTFRGAYPSLLASASAIARFPSSKCYQETK
jgi:hypothetical protein